MDVSTFKDLTLKAQTDRGVKNLLSHDLDATHSIAGEMSFHLNLPVAAKAASKSPIKHQILRDAFES